MPRAPRLAAAAALVALAAGAQASAPPLAGPAPQHRAVGYDAPAENLACEACHADIAAEWRGSLHHRAWDDGVFQTAYALEPISFCRGCHAPEADPAHLPPEGARRLGVGCVTCHVPSGAVVGAHPAAPRAGAHEVRADARLATESACAPCHQFEFPIAQRAAMQSTADEHRASAHAGESCQTCHMAPVAGAGGVKHRSHDFRIVGAPEALASALSAHAARDGARTIDVSLRAARIGHDLPTGDMFRRLEVRARAVDARGEITDQAPPAILSRRFLVIPDAEGPRRLQIGDDRLSGSGAPRRIELTFPGDVSRRAVRWEVVYQRMDPGMSRAFGVDPALDEVIVASGVLPPR